MLEGAIASMGVFRSIVDGAQECSASRTVYRQFGAPGRSSPAAPAPLTVI